MYTPSRHGNIKHGTLGHTCSPSASAKTWKEAKPVPLKTVMLRRRHIGDTCKTALIEKGHYFHRAVESDEYG